MKLFNILSLILFVNVILLSVFIPQSTALSRHRRKMYAVKKLGALAMIMKMQQKRKMLIPIPIPIPIGLIKELKRKKSNEERHHQMRNQNSEFFCEHHHQINSLPQIHTIGSWPNTIIKPTAEVIPAQITVHQDQLNSHHNLQTETAAIRQQPAIQSVQTIHPIAIKSEPIILAAQKPITIPVHMQPNHIVLPPDTETVEIRPEPIIEIEQQAEPINEQPLNNQYLTKNRRAHLQNREYMHMNM